MSISAIVPYYASSSGRLPYLSLCLASLTKASNGNLNEILVVLNGECACEPPEGILETGHEVRVLEASRALGYGGAVNFGARQARSEFLLFCDADTFNPEPGWADHHLSLHAGSSRVGATSSKLVNHRTGRILDFGIGRTRFNHFHPFRDLPVDHQRTRHSRRAQMACSAVMMIKKNLFLKLGGFDETLRYHYQDLDLCLRLKRENREVWVIGNAVAFHRGGSATLVRNPFKTDERAYYTTKNESLMEADFTTYLTESLAIYSKHLESTGSFGLVDLSTMTDSREATDVISQYAALNPLLKSTPQERDLETITLPDVLSSAILRRPGPLLLLVDRHISLQPNALWRASRDTSADLVVDRHANVCHFDELTR